MTTLKLFILVVCVSASFGFVLQDPDPEPQELNSVCKAAVCDGWIRQNGTVTWDCNYSSWYETCSGSCYYCSGSVLKTVCRANQVGPVCEIQVVGGGPEQCGNKWKAPCVKKLGEESCTCFETMIDWGATPENCELPRCQNPQP